MSTKVDSKKFKDAIKSIESIPTTTKEIIEQLLNSITKDSDNPEIPIEVDQKKV